MLSNLAVALRLGAVFLIVSALLFAHHGTATSYDNSKTFTTQATVTEFRYANPHPQLYFDVKDEQGNVAHWSGEIAPNPAQLIQVGWGRKRSEAALAPGTVITITISPSRVMDAHVGLVQKIVGGSGELVLGTIALNPGGAEPAPKK
jgi:Family of unknown function (DUF6152)